MKPKIKSKIFSLLIILNVFGVSAQTEIDVDGIKYLCVSDSASVVGPSQTNPVGVLVLPVSVNAGNADYNVTSISDNAFSGCDRITSVDMPAGLRSIGGNAFSGCTGLSSITLPAALISLGNGAFDGCENLMEINVDPGNIYMVSEDGILYTKDMVSLMLCPPGKSGAVIVNAGTRQVKESGFANCKYITSVDMSQALSFVGISKNAFYQCTALESVIFPASLQVIGSNAFDSCISLTLADMSGCLSLEYISFNVFALCESLQNIYVPSDNIYYATENGILYSKDMTYLISVPGAKQDPVTINPAVRRIDDYTFSSCKNLTSIDLSACTNLVTIGTNAFEGCSALTSVQFSPSVILIGAEAFNGCSSLQSIELPASLKTFGPSQFFGCNQLQTINVSPANTSFTSEDGILYSKDMTKIIACPPAKTGTIATPVTVEVIDVAAFAYCESITSLDMTASTSLTQINEGAFISDISLNFMQLPESLTNIGNKAFDGCTNLITIVFYGINEPSIATTAFGYTPRLRTVYVPNATGGFTASKWGSNAIIKYGDLPTGVEKNEITEKSTFSGGAGTINIRTVPETFFSIYNITGTEIYKGKSSADETHIPVGISGVYVVKAADRTGKVTVY